MGIHVRCRWRNRKRPVDGVDGQGQEQENGGLNDGFCAAGEQG